MWAGGESGGTDSTDDLALVHMRAGPNIRRNGAQVRIACSNLSGMAKLDEPTIRAHESCSRDDPGCGGLDRRSVRRTVVDPLVRPPALEDGVITATREVAGDPVGHRITQE